MSVPATFFLGATQALGVDLLNTGAPSYGILTAGTTATAGGFLAAVAGQLGGIHGGKPVITPDSVLALEWHGEERISDYPLMDGTFASFNKVKVPYDLRIVMTCQGLNYVQTILQSATQLIDQALSNLGLAFGQPMERSDFLQQLDAMLEDTQLYDVVTPDKVYRNVNLVSYNHAKRNDEGATMIIAELLFREVRVSQESFYGNPIASSSESAASPVNVGTVTGTAPTASQTAAFNFAFPGL